MKFKFIKVKRHILRSDQIKRISQIDKHLTFILEDHELPLQIFFEDEEEAKEERDRIYKELQAL